MGDATLPACSTGLAGWSVRRQVPDGVFAGPQGNLIRPERFHIHANRRTWE